MRSISRTAASLLGGLALAGGGVFFVAPTAHAATPAGAPGQSKCSYDIPNDQTTVDTTVHLRSRSSAKSTSLGLIKGGIYVETHCVDKTRKWVKVTVDSGPNANRVGWVKEKYLSGHTCIPEYC